MNRTRQRPVVARMLASSGSTRHGLFKTGTRTHGFTPAHPSRRKNDFAPGEAPAPHRRAKSCSVWSSGQAGRGAKLDSASRQTEHSLQYNGSGWLRNPYFVYVMTKRKGEGSLTLLPEPRATEHYVVVVDGLAAASCTLHDQPMPVKPPARGSASRRPSIASANRSTRGPSLGRRRRGGGGSANDRRPRAQR